MAWFLRMSQLGLVSISGKCENQLRPIFARWHSKPFSTSNNERVLQTNCQTYIFVSSISFAFTYYFVNMYYVHNSRNITCKSAFFPFNQNDVTCHFPHNFQKELIWLYMEKRLTTIKFNKMCEYALKFCHVSSTEEQGWVQNLASVSNINVFQSSIPKMQVSFIALEHECVRYRLQKTGFCWILLRLRSSMLVVCWQWLMGKYSLSMHNHYEPWQQPSRD